MPWQHLLHPTARLDQPACLRTWFADLVERLAQPEPFTLAVLGGRAAPSPGLAFLSGYQAALRALCADAPAGLGALCATEGRSLRPADLQTRFDGARVQGHKSYVAAGDAADWLLVSAREEADGESPRLALLRLPMRSEGVTLEVGPLLPLMPDVPHARLRLDAVLAERLPGDGWNDYVKPFRSLEDLYVQSALTAWLYGVGQACGWSQALQLRLLAQLAAASELSRLAPGEATTHVLLGALFAGFEALTPQVDEALQAGPAHWNQLWQRDRGILGMAGAARAKRLEKAWQRFI